MSILYNSFKLYLGREIKVSAHPKMTAIIQVGDMQRELTTVRKHIYYLFVASFFILFFLITPATVSSQEPASSPVRKNNSGELSIDTDFDAIPGTYYYDVFLKGIRLGKATITVTKNDEEYTVQVTAKTRGIVKYLYKVKYRGEVAVTTNPLQPITAIIEEESGIKKKTIHVNFPKPNKVTAVEFESKHGQPPTRTENEFNSESFVLDPFSIVYLIRSLKWEVGTAEIFDVFTGKKQYEIQLVCRGETVLDINGVKRRAWEIIPQTRTLTKPQELRMSGFVIYLSNDPLKEILKITGHPKIGRIVVKVRKFSPM